MFFHLLTNDEQYAHYKHVNGSTCSSSKFVVKILRQIQIQNHRDQLVDVSLVDVFQNYQMLHLKIVNLVIYTVTEHQCFILSRRVARE